MNETLFIFILLSIWNIILTISLLLNYNWQEDLLKLIRINSEEIFDLKVDLDVLEKKLYETQDSVIYKEGKGLGV